MTRSIEYKISTQYGVFAFKFTVHVNRDTGQNETYGINLGSKSNKCVQLTIPTPESGKTEGYLMWVEADENCSMEKYIERGLAQHMVLLGIQLARSFNRHLTRIYLDDESAFECQLPNKTQLVPMKRFHIAFHQATWYEFYFGAKLVKDHDIYLAEKENMYRPERKPDTFNFINPTLQHYLEPLYKSSQNWYEFFQKISNVYGRQKCGIVYAWLSRALSCIFDSNRFDDIKWYIDLFDNPKLIHIDITLRERIDGGGKRRKTRKARRYTISRTLMFPHIRKIQGWDYKSFLKSAVASLHNP